MQEAFLRVWERWDRVRNLENPTGYLYTTAYNLFRKYVSRLRRNVGRRIIGVVRDPIAEADERAIVLAALRHLPVRQRTALVLIEFLGYRSEEAGRLMGITATTVRVLASQGRSAMRKRLEEAP